MQIGILAVLIIIGIVSIAAYLMISRIATPTQRGVIIQRTSGVVAILAIIGAIAVGLWWFGVPFVGGGSSSKSVSVNAPANTTPTAVNFNPSDPKVTQIKTDVASGKTSIVDATLQIKAMGATDNQIKSLALSMVTTPSGSPTAGSTTPTTGSTPAGTPQAGSKQVLSVGQIPSFPADIDANVPRLSSTSAPLNQWYHPIWNDILFKSSGGMMGQWNWTNSLVQINQQGGNFIQAPDGELWFRHTAPAGTFSFGVKTTSKYKSEFMGSAGNLPIQISIDAFPTGSVVHVLDENGKDLNGGNPITLSIAGQTAITLPDDGITVITVSEVDPAGVFDFKARVGPDDRPNTTNHFDARVR